MPEPLFYILAPVGLALGLFVVYLIVAIVIKDPTRPFRMFKAPPIDPGEAEGAGRGAQGAEEQGAGRRTEGAEEEETEEDPVH